MQYQDNAPHERGSRRRRLAAMAGSVYRAGVAAAGEIRDQYNNSRAAPSGERGDGMDTWESDRPPNIPGAFPDVAFATGGNAQMVIFPMYAKRHERRYNQLNGRATPRTSAPAKGSAEETYNDEGWGDGPPRNSSVDSNFWHREFERHEDERAVVDVNVHGWIYLSQHGPLNRKHRLLIGLARRLSGIPAPSQWVAAAGAADSSIAEEDDPSEKQKIARAAEAIERRGQSEKEVANRGGYSETPETATSYDDNDDSSDSAGPSIQRISSRPSRHAGRRGSGYNTPASRTSSPGGSPGPGRKLTPKSSWATSVTGGGGSPLEMTEAELAAANTNLLARLGPFMTTPIIQQPVTLFFYNEEQSQSRTVETTEVGHFSICASLDFIPTHVRVLVSGGNNGGPTAGGGSFGYGESALVSALTEPLSAVAPIDLVEDRGVSLISDIDDTIKASNIALGTREIFRNTFVRDLADMAVDGVREWYGALGDLGVQFHYCSNSPWQLFPMLTTFFKKAGLPKGPLHLKQYSGMLQGIFEPVAERKRGTLEKILRDFPHRKFLLVGDSGEADLEVYTDLVMAHPGRILAIFIRDVTTPEQPGYFDASTSAKTLQLPSSPADYSSKNSKSSSSERRPPYPPRTASAPAQKEPAPEGPVMGTLIDFSDDGGADTVSSPPPASSTASRAGSISGNSSGTPTRKPLPPPRPSKPLALRSSMAAPPHTAVSTISATASPPPPSSSSSSSSLSSIRSGMQPPPPPKPRRPATTSNVSSSKSVNINNSSIDSKTNNSSNNRPVSTHPLAQVKNSSSLTSKSSGATATAPNAEEENSPPPPPPPPRRTQTIGADGGGLGTPTPQQQQPQQQHVPHNKKVDMWRRRLAHAQALLGPQGVSLYTWRRGHDVAVEAVGIVKSALKEMAEKGQ